MTIAAGVLLVIYLSVIVFALRAPVRQPDPQRGQAVGCLMIVAGGLVVLGALLGVAVAFDISWLAEGVSSVVIFPALLVLANGVYLLYRRLR